MTEEKISAIIDEKGEITVAAKEFLKIKHKERQEYLRLTELHRQQDLKILNSAKRKIESFRNLELIVSPSISTFKVRAKIPMKGDVTVRYPKEYSVPERWHPLPFVLRYYRIQLERTALARYAKEYLAWVDHAIDEGLVTAGNDNYSKLQVTKQENEELRTDNFTLAKSRENLKEQNEKLSKEIIQIRKERDEAYDELDKGRENLGEKKA